MLFHCETIPYDFPNVLPFQAYQQDSHELQFKAYQEMSDHEHQDLRWLFSHSATAYYIAQTGGYGVSCLPEDAFLRFRREPVRKASQPTHGRAVPTRSLVAESYDFTLDLWCPKLDTEDEGYLDYYHFRLSGNYQNRVPLSDPSRSSEIEGLCGVKKEIKFETLENQPLRLSTETNEEKLQKQLSEKFGVLSEQIKVNGSEE